MLFLGLSGTGWRRLIGPPELQIIFHKRATKYRSLLRKMTYKDKGSYESAPPCSMQCKYRFVTGCTTLQHTATHCNTLQHTTKTGSPSAATLCNTLQFELCLTGWCVAVCCSVVHTATHGAHCNTLQLEVWLALVSPTHQLDSLLHHTAPHCTTLHHTAPHRTTRHHTTPHCNTLQCAAPRCSLTCL